MQSSDQRQTQYTAMWGVQTLFLHINTTNNIAKKTVTSIKHNRKAYKQIGREYLLTARRLYCHCTSIHSTSGGEKNRTTLCDVVNLSDMSIEEWVSLLFKFCIVC